jgi:hypothetical protein
MVGLQLATKVQRWVKVKEKVENQARRADRQERVHMHLNWFNLAGEKI